MAIVKAINSRASIGNAVRYICQTEKTDTCLTSGLHCAPDTALDEMRMTKAFWGKTGGRQYKHYVQSFPPDEKISPEEAHTIARELAAEVFAGFEVLIATHTDREHIHTHFIVNSVSLEDGHKYRESKQDLQRIKDRSTALCVAHGKSVCEKKDDITADNSRKYRALANAITSGKKSYLVDSYKAVCTARQTAASRADFIAILKQRGYDVQWTDARKHITFTDQDGHKIRNSNLSKTFKEDLSKEALDHVFETNLANASRPTPVPIPNAAPIRATGQDRTGEHAPQGRVGAVERTMRDVVDQVDRLAEGDHSKKTRKSFRFSLFCSFLYRSIYTLYSTTKKMR